MNHDRKKQFDSAKRIVVKVGSGVLTAGHGLNIQAIQTISRQIGILSEKGIEFVLVSSGAIASGLKKVGLSKRPGDIPGRQAAAAIGQAGLILEYEKAFYNYNKKVAQILLTRDDLKNRKRYLNARNTLNKLDLTEAEKPAKAFQSEIRDKTVVMVSAATGKNIKNLKQEIARLLEQINEP